MYIPKTLENRIDVSGDGARTTDRYQVIEDAEWVKKFIKGKRLFEKAVGGA